MDAGAPQEVHHDERAHPPADAHEGDVDHRDAGGGEHAVGPGAGVHQVVGEVTAASGAHIGHVGGHARPG